MIDTQRPIFYIKDSKTGQYLRGIRELQHFKDKRDYYRLYFDRNKSSNTHHSLAELETILGQFYGVYNEEIFRQKTINDTKNPKFRELRNRVDIEINELRKNITEIERLVIIADFNDKIQEEEYLEQIFDIVQTLIQSDTYDWLCSEYDFFRQHEIWGHIKEVLYPYKKRMKKTYAWLSILDPCLGADEEFKIIENLGIKFQCITGGFYSFSNEEDVNLLQLATNLVKHNTLILFKDVKKAHDDIVAKVNGFKFFAGLV